jgi:hypothetical protein
MFENNKKESIKSNPKLAKLNYLENLLQKMDNGESNLEDNVANKRSSKEQQLLELNNRGLARDEQNSQKLDTNYLELNSKYKEVRNNILSDLEAKSKLISIDILKSKGYDTKDERLARRKYYSDLIREADKKTYDEKDPRYALMHKLELDAKSTYSESIKQDNKVEDAKVFSNNLQSEILEKQNNTKLNLKNSIQHQIDKLKSELGGNSNFENNSVNEIIDSNENEITVDHQELEVSLDLVDIKLGKFNYYPSRELEKNGAFNLTAIDKELERVDSDKKRLEILTYKSVITTILEKVENGESIKLDLDNDNTYDMVEELYIEQLPQVLEQNGFVGI